MSCTTLHEDIIIAILAENYPKTIYNMVAFEFANTVAIQLEFKGLCAKIHYMLFEKGSNGSTIITMQLLGKNYPSFIYGMAIFEFGQNLTKFKEISGADLQNDHAPKFRGAKCKIVPHHAD